MTLPEWANWLARDRDGELYVFEKKPIKSVGDGEWFEFECGRLKTVEETDDTFETVKWEDEFPTIVDKDGDEITSISFEEAMALVENKMEYYVPEQADMVNHPNHYKQGGLETIDIMQALLPHEQFIGYLKGNIIKYRERAEHKGNAEQDYAKAKWYYDKLIEHTEG